MRPADWPAKVKGQRATIAWLAVTILIAFALRVFHLDYQSLWRDEVDAIRFSTDAPSVLWRMMLRQGHNGPLYFLVLHGWRVLTGDSEFALRYLSTVGGTLAVALTFQIGRQFRLGRRAALIVATLVATSPYLIWYSQEAKMYSWLLFLVSIAVYVYRQALNARKSTRWWVIFVVVTSLSYYVHILAPLMLAVYGVWALIEWERVKTRWREWLLAMAFLTVPYLPLLWWEVPLLQNGFNSGHPFYPLREQLWLLLHFYSAGVLRSQVAVALIGVMIFLALLGVFYPLQRPKQRLALLLWFFIPALLVNFISLHIPVFEDRYVIYLAPAFYLLVALGISLLVDHARWVGVGVIIALVAFNLWAVYRQDTYPIKADFRAAARYIAEHSDADATLRRQIPPAPSAAPSASAPHSIYLPLIMNNRLPVVMLQMPYLQYTFNYYFDRPYSSLEGLWTNDGRSLATVDEEMRRRTAGVRDLWLVVSEEDQWDNRHLTRQWLNNHAILQAEAHFTGVDVYRYQMGGQGADGEIK